MYKSLEVSGAVRPIYGSLGVKWLDGCKTPRCSQNCVHVQLFTQASLQAVELRQEPELRC